MPSELAYRREIYKLWFEYLKVARVSKSPAVKAALAESAEFYAPWGDVTDVSFPAWWKTHEKLFLERYAVRRVEHGDYPVNQLALVIEVPLNLPLTRLIRQVKIILRQEMDMRLGKGSKKKRPTSFFYPTLGAMPKLLAVREMLTVYRDVYLKNPTLRGEKLLEAVHAYYKSRRNERKAKVPTPLMTTGYTGIARPLRNLRRYIQKAEKVVHNVAKGEFPGPY